MPNIGAFERWDTIVEAAAECPFRTIQQNGSTEALVRMLSLGAATWSDCCRLYSPLQLTALPWYMTRLTTPSEGSSNEVPRSMVSQQNPLLTNSLTTFKHWRQ